MKLLPAVMKFLPVLLFSAVASASTINVHVLDASGAPAKDVLVIVQDLGSKERDVSRALTDSQGRIPGLDLSRGIYRGIATQPYGLWKTAITEFVASTSKTITLKVDALPTHGYGDIVTVGTQKTMLRVNLPNGKPAAHALAIVRDSEATLHLERRYRTNAEGETQIELVSTPTLVVVVYEDQLISLEVSSDDSVVMWLGQPSS